MGDAAQSEPRKHEVFSTPFEVKPKLTFWKTPKNYRRYPGGDELKAEVRVWRVQNTGKSSGGVVSRSYGFEDSPDAEVLTAGYNTGKESGAVGVGRHGNFLQWGFSAPPSKMTEAGRIAHLSSNAPLFPFVRSCSMRHTLPRSRPSGRPMVSQEYIRGRRRGTRAASGVPSTLPRHDRPRVRSR